MKKFMAITLATVLVLTLGIGSGVVLADKPIDNGNGAPSGAHYNLNIIGVPNDMNANFTGGNGSRIFVDRDGITKFYVYGDDAPYQVLDHDGTDGMVGQPGRGEANAGIILPYVGEAYKVEIYARQVGPMTSSSHWTSVGWDGDSWEPIGEFTLNREDKKFQLKTGDLLDDAYRDIIWTLDQKTKFRIVQLRIYLID